MPSWTDILMGKAHDRVDALPMTAEQALDIKKYTTTIKNAYDDVFLAHMRRLEEQNLKVNDLQAERQRMLTAYDRLYALTTETAERAIRAEIERDALKLILEAK